MGESVFLFSLFILNYRKVWEGEGGVGRGARERGGVGDCVHHTYEYAPNFMNI